VGVGCGVRPHTPKPPIPNPQSPFPHSINIKIKSILKFIKIKSKNKIFKIIYMFKKPLFSIIIDPL
jgi:hypothetical protein